jgi:hypothetical protein
LEFLAVVSLQPAESINEGINLSDLYRSKKLSKWSDWERREEKWKMNFSIPSEAELLLPIYQTERFGENSSKALEKRPVDGARDLGDVSGKEDVHSLDWNSRLQGWDRTMPG